MKLQDPLFLFYDWRYYDTEKFSKKLENKIFRYWADNLKMVEETMIKN